jgi:hypothetical protein
MQISLPLAVLMLFLTLSQLTSPVIGYSPFSCSSKITLAGEASAPSIFSGSATNV